jgi:hypothetical protein
MKLGTCISMIAILAFCVSLLNLFGNLGWMPSTKIRIGAVKHGISEREFLERVIASGKWANAYNLPLLTGDIPEVDRETFCKLEFVKLRNPSLLTADALADE